MSEELKNEEAVNAENVQETALPADVSTEEKSVAEEPVVEVSMNSEVAADAEPAVETPIDVPEVPTVAAPVKSKKASMLENFDWEAYEKGETYTDVSKEKLIEPYDHSLSKINDREVVIGTVQSMNKREVVINIGYKSDGVVSMTEFRYNPDLKVGDEVEVFIESQEDKKGQLILSHKKARATRSWDRVNAALENNEIVKGYVKCRTKGGMIVDIFGIEAFLPGSQIDVKPIRDYDVFVDKTMEFKVVKINQEFKNVVVSHKALIEAELEQQKKDIIAKLEKGQVL